MNEPRDFSRDFFWAAESSSATVISAKISPEEIGKNKDEKLAQKKQSQVRVGLGGGAETFGGTLELLEFGGDVSDISEAVVFRTEGEKVLGGLGVARFIHESLFMRRGGG